MNSLALDAPSPPPPTYKVPLESRATAHKKATPPSSTSFITGARLNRPSLESERCVSVPFSKSAVPDCCQTFVSTAKAAVETNTKTRDQKMRMRLSSHHRASKLRVLCLNGRANSP